MKTSPSPRPILWRRKPKFGLAKRMKATAIAVVFALLLVPFITWAQSAPATAPAGSMAAASAPAATGAAASAPAKQDYSATQHPSFSAATQPDPTGGTAVGAWNNPAFTPTDKDGNALSKDKDGNYVGLRYDDKTGAILGTGDNVPTLGMSDLYARITHNQVAINMVWTLVTGFLVMFMQFGFAAVETGLCRAKNAGHTYAMNMMIYPLGCLGFWAYGFAIGWGNWFNGPAAPGWYPALGQGTAVLNSGFGIGANGDGTFHWGLIGLKGFFLSSSVSDVSVMALFFFMMVFMDTTATIPTGAMAERWSWNSFVIYGLWIAFPYCLFANWVWGGGWLAQMGQNWGLGNGACDFAGSGVVHCMGGVIALAGALCIGPRIGKFINGKAQAIPGHDLPMVMGGTFVLAFGWFGFNPGSTLSGTDLRISFIVVNTMLAGIAGAISAMVVMQMKFGKPDPSMMCNGMLAGLVAITAPCAFVSPIAAFVIGTAAGVIVVFSVFFFDNMGVDDPVGAISVHGVNGAFGVLSVGLFANGDYGAGFGGLPTTVKGIMPISSVSGLQWFTHEGFMQLAAQGIDVGVLVVTGFTISFVLFKLTNMIVPLRVSREVEIQGLDIPEMGALGYPDFELKTTQSVSDVGAPHAVKA